MKILVVGGGKIGSAISHILTNKADYEVVLLDQFSKDSRDQKYKTAQCDINDDNAFEKVFKSEQFDAVISSLPYYCNVVIAKKACQHNLHYFDLTEDVETTSAITEIAKGSDKVFVPQCGFAPGFINIAANGLMRGYEELDTVKLRAGALPQHASNYLQYALTWSTDGLINEYGNPCEAIINGKHTQVLPLEGLEQLVLNGIPYEAFNTSGGLSSLWKTYDGKVKSMDYKTLRYPGHCEKIKFLMNDLDLNNDRETLKKILEKNIPATDQDQVVLQVSVTGKKNKRFLESNLTKTLYPETVNGRTLTAIQASTASGMCGVVDMVLTKQYKLSGFVMQEQFLLTDFLNNRFGQYYAL